MFSKREPSVVQFLLTVVSVFLVSLTYSNLLSGPVGVGLSESAVPAAQSTLAFVVGLTSSLLYYRLYSRRHPLYGVPGPFAARCSQLWLFSRVVRGQTRHDMRAVHKKYGDIVSFLLPATYCLKVAHCLRVRCASDRMRLV